MYRKGLILLLFMLLYIIHVSQNKLNLEHDIYYEKNFQISLFKLFLVTSANCVKKWII